MFCDASMLVELRKIAEVHFRLLGTNGFHVKAENERITDASSNTKISPRHLADYVKKLHQLGAARAARF